MSRQFNRKYKNKAQALMYRSRDWGWVFSRRLLASVQRRMGLTDDEADRLFEVLGQETYKLMTAGHPFGLPHCPVMYTRMYGSHKFKHGNSKTYFVKNRVLTRVHSPEQYRNDVKEITDRGDLRYQYEKDRLSLTGKPRKKGGLGQPPKYLPEYKDGENPTERKKVAREYP